MVIAAVEKGSSTPVGWVAMPLCQFEACFWHSPEADWPLNVIYLDTIEIGALFMQLAHDCSASDQPASCLHGEAEADVGED